MEQAYQDPSDSSTKPHSSLSSGRRISITSFTLAYWKLDESRGSKPTRGVPPFGHKTHLRVFIDPDLLQYDEVWAAAGTWHDVFGIEPHKLVEASEGLVTDLKRA